MQDLVLERRKIDDREYDDRHAQDDDCSIFVKDSCRIFDEVDGDPKIIYLELSDLVDADAIIAMLDEVEFVPSYRTGTMLTNSKTFGYLPRNTIRRDFCTSSGLATQYPEVNAALCQLALDMCIEYGKMNPALFESHKELTEERVLPEWRLPGEVFTSGIVNKNTPLRYHYDRGNFKKVWSCMIMLKRDVDGGHLAVPEYDRVFELPNGSMFCFDGQGILHGVTPIRAQNPNSVRYSIVFYTMEQMWKCLTPKEELARIRELKTKRERERV